MKRVKLSFGIAALALALTASAFTTSHRNPQGWFQYISGDVNSPSSYAQIDFTKNDNDLPDFCPTATTLCAAKFLEGTNSEPVGTPELFRNGTFTAQ